MFALSYSTWIGLVLSDFAKFIIGTGVSLFVKAALKLSINYFSLEDLLERSKINHT